MNIHTINPQTLVNMGEVAVYNGSWPTAFRLFYDGSKYLAVGINDTEKFLSPDDQTPEKLIYKRRIACIIQGIELTCGKQSFWDKKSRKSECVIARHVFYWAVRTACPKLSLYSISKLLNHKKDHATVIHSIRIVQRDIQAKSPQLMDIIYSINSVLLANDCNIIDNEIKKIQEDEAAEMRKQLVELAKTFEFKSEKAKEAHANLIKSLEA